MSICNKASLAILSNSMIGMKRKDDRVTDYANTTYSKNGQTAPQPAAGDKGYYRKNKYQRSDFEDIFLTASQARAYNRKMTYDWDNRFRIISGEHILEWIAQLNQFKERFVLGVEEKVRILPNIIQRNMHLLDDMYDADDYITQPRLFKSEFAFEHRIYPIADRNHLVIDLEAEVLDDLRDQMDKDHNQRLDNMMDDMWTRLAEPVEKMVIRLSDSKPKFKKSLISNIEDQIKMLTAANVMRNKDLDALLAEAHNRLCSFTAKQLKEDSRAKKQVWTDAADILRRINTARSK